MLNDCLYQLKNLYEFVIVLDPDEIPIPVRGHKTLHDFAKTFVKESKPIDCYSFLSVTYPDLGVPPVPKFPAYHYMLQHTRVR